MVSDSYVIPKDDLMIPKFVQVVCLSLVHVLNKSRSLESLCIARSQIDVFTAVQWNLSTTDKLCLCPCREAVPFLEVVIAISSLRFATVTQLSTTLHASSLTVIIHCYC